MAREEGASALLKFVDGFQDHVAGDRNASRADFVQSVLGRVPISKFYVIVVVNEVNGGNFTIKKWVVVVGNSVPA